MSSTSILPEKSSRKEAPPTSSSVSLTVQQRSRSIGKSVKKPVVIYVVSPKIIEVQPSEFMSMVQLLTGYESLASSSDELGGRRRRDRGSPSKLEEMSEERSRPAVPTRRASSDQLSSWKSFFAIAKDSSDFAAPNKWLLDGGPLRKKACPSSPGSSSPRQFIDVFCQVSPNSGD